MKNQKAVKVQTSKVLGKNGEVIEATLDDIVKQIKKAILNREYVMGSKTYQTNLPLVKGYLSSAYACTVELIQRGKENGGMDEDKYNLLTAKTKSFGTKNEHINDLLTEIIEERAQDAKDRHELDMDENPEQPITEEEQAKLLAEPTADPDTHVVDVTTKDGGELKFDKNKAEVTITNTDGTTQTVAMSKLETWRKTAMAWISALCKTVKEKATKAVEAVSDFFGKINPFKKPEGLFLNMEVGEDGTLYYDPATLPEGSVVPKGAVPRPVI